MAATAGPCVGSDGLDTVAVREASPVDGYLFSALRTLLFAAELRSREQLHREFVAICDQTAQNLVLQLNLAQTVCKASLDHRQLPELFGDQVPPGVVEGWRTHRWRDQAPSSFACPR